MNTAKCLTFVVFVKHEDDFQSFGKESYEWKIQTNMTATNQSLWYLENIDVIGILCPSKRKQGAHENIVHKMFKKGEYIYLPEESSDKLYFISEGSIKVGSYSEDGKEITKAILNKGEVFGELALVGEGQRRDFAVAQESTIACVVTVEEMRTLMRDHSSVGLFIMNLIGSRLLKMERRLESLVFKDSRTRIVEFLLEMVNENGKRVGYEWVVRKFYTHQEIANLTATSRQTVTTVLNELRNDNLITFNRKRLLVRDREALEAEAVAT